MTAMDRPLPVVVVGGGLAGLSAASYLNAHGVPVRLFEASSKLAGLSRSEIGPDGFTYDFGAHFITNRLAAATGVSADCSDMVRYDESVLLDGASYSYPFGLMRKPSFLASAIVARIANLGRSSKPDSAFEWYSANYGRALTEHVAAPLSEAWSGVPARELAASVGSKITSITRTMFLTAAKAVTGRTVAIGYSSTFPENPHVWHVYPHGGIGSVCEKIADGIRDCIATESPVEAILVEGGRVTGVRVKGQTVAASAVVSTAPVHILAKLVQGTDKLEYLKSFEYRPMVFVNIKLSGPSGLPGVVTWTPEKDLPFFRLSDIGAGLPFLVPSGKSLVTCDIGCQLNDATWAMSDEALAQTCLDGLERIVPGIKTRFIGHKVMRVPLAYPVFRASYENDLQKFAAGTGIEGLISVGRNGEFKHLLMEDVYWRTRAKMVPLVEAHLQSCRVGAPR